MKTITKRGVTTGSLLFLFLPSFALAQVQITEIMYDAHGSDTGTEWVEVTNLGTQQTDIGKFKLLESGTNHSLKLVSGSALLMPQASAILASDAQKFLAANPGFSGTLFDTAFSLSNTGETLVLKNASSTALDTASYAAVPDANGTGGTLNMQGNSFVAAMASPGIYPGPMKAVPPAPAKAAPIKKTAGKTSATSSSKSKRASAAAAKTAEPSFVAQDANAAAAAEAPALPPYVLWALGLVAVVLLGVAGIFFLMKKGNTTPLAAEEFKIE